MFAAQRVAGPSNLKVGGHFRSLFGQVLLSLRQVLWDS